MIECAIRSYYRHNLSLSAMMAEFCDRLAPPMLESPLDSSHTFAEELMMALLIVHVHTVMAKSVL